MKQPFKIKICGVTTTVDAVMVADSGADAIGLNFYPNGKRYIPIDSAKEIVASINAYRSELTVVGVFVNASIGLIVDHAKQISLDVIQLHGDEAVHSLPILRESLSRSGLNCRVIRALRMAPDSDAAPIDQQVIQAEILAWASAGIDGLLIDAAVADSFGGTGKQVDWHGFSSLRSSIPLYLAGGLKPSNIQHAITTAHPFGVDVASGVEVSPGIKDEAAVRRFVALAKATLTE